MKKPANEFATKRLLTDGIFLSQRICFDFTQNPSTDDIRAFVAVTSKNTPKGRIE